MLFPRASTFEVIRLFSFRCRACFLAACFVKLWLAGVRSSPRSLPLSLPLSRLLLLLLFILLLFIEHNRLTQTI